MKWYLRLALALIGLGVMAIEGRYNPAPGIGWVVGMACILLAVLIGSAKSPNPDKGDDYDSY